MVRNLPSFNIGSGNFDIDCVIRGLELEQLSFYAEHLRSRAHELDIVDADTILKLNKPELRVQIDRARAADLGVDTDDISRALRLMVGGEENVSRFRDPSLNEDYDVQLRLREGQRNDPETILRVSVAPGGRAVAARQRSAISLGAGRRRCIRNSVSSTGTMGGSKRRELSAVENCLNRDGKITN
jgi:hydrophobic/amphiphilic exporter-1 (mainly G- bacteria), HAE1 family